MTGAANHRGESRQDYETPRAFIDAVVARFGMLHFDLAASLTNAKSPLCFTEEEDSLAQDWTQLRGNLWLNPPFGNIAPWAKKCAETCASEPDNRILFLTPASIGSEWCAKYVYPHARIYALRGRLSFDGKSPFPKDCMLAEFPGSGFEIWGWR